MHNISHKYFSNIVIINKSILILTLFCIRVIIICGTTYIIITDFGKEELTINI